MHRGLRRGLALILVTTMVSAQSLAQTPDWPGEIDLDPPVIDHEALVTGISAEQQAFSAIVVDDRGLEHVMLFHRNRSGAEYASVQMQNVAGSDEYTATIDTAVGQTRIEYYIEALDTGGNRVLKGFPFFPLVRDLNVPTANVAQELEPDEATDRRLIYVLLGVAAVGVAALALAGGSDDGGNDGGGDTQPGPGTVPLIIEVSPPTTPDN